MSKESIKLIANNKKAYHDYFIENKARYDLDCNHRILSVAQLFGLLSKSNPFERGSRYNTETTTPVFNYLKRYRIGSPEYNAIKTEQLLKLDRLEHNFDVNTYLEAKKSS